jgi:hypothetical protein
LEGLQKKGKGFIWGTLFQGVASPLGLRRKLADLPNFLGKHQQLLTAICKIGTRAKAFFGRGRKLADLP